MALVFLFLFWSQHNMVDMGSIPASEERTVTTLFLPTYNKDAVGETVVMVYREGILLVNLFD